jgi:CCR4-NOT transcription complex subunit 1
MLQRLLVDLFQYMAPFLRGGLMDGQLPDSVRLLYKGSLRMLLVLLHDFPEFLASYHFSLCDAIPAECIQMRNLILSAFPRAMRLPDPFTPNLKIDLLPEIAQAPRFLSPYAAAFATNQALRQAIDSFFRGETVPQFLAELPAQFHRPAEYVAFLPYPCVLVILVPRASAPMFLPPRICAHVDQTLI